MTPLDKIEERHAAWYDGDLGRAEWADCTADEAADADEDTLARLMAARMIVRNDVPALVTALRAVLKAHEPMWDDDGTVCAADGARLGDDTPDCPTVAALVAALDGAA